MVKLKDVSNFITWRVGLVNKLKSLGLWKVVIDTIFEEPSGELILLNKLAIGETFNSVDNSIIHYIAKYTSAGEMWDELERFNKSSLLYVEDWSDSDTDEDTWDADIEEVPAANIIHALDAADDIDDVQDLAGDSIHVFDKATQEDKTDDTDDVEVIHKEDKTDDTDEKEAIHVLDADAECYNDMELLAAVKETYQSNDKETNQPTTVKESMGFQQTDSFPVREVAAIKTKPSNF
jgi:hypothetical protein